MNQEIYTVDYFLSFFSQIPEDRWCVGIRIDHSGRCCAIGHVAGWRDCSPPLDPLNKLVSIWGGDGTDYYKHSSLHGLYLLARVNNGQDSRYQQPTPKQRILAALHDIKRQQEEQKPAQMNVVTAALAAQMPCHHNYVMGVCFYCCSTKPVERKELV